MPTVTAPEHQPARPPTAHPPGVAIAPRRIALALETDGPGGAEVMLIQLAEELRRRGHSVLCIGPEKGEGWLRAQLAERGFERVSFRLSGPLDPGCVLRLRRLLKEKGIEVVHSHEFTMAVYCSVAAALNGIPHVCTMHGNFNMLNVWRRRIALRLAFRLSRAVVAVSEATRGHLLEKMDLPPAKVRAILNGISYTAGERDRVRAELGIGEGELMVLALGRLIVLKGHRVLLRAMERLDQAGVPKNWHVVVAGHGRLEAELKRQLADAGLTGRAHILGYRKDVSDLLAASDIFVMPSLWEGLPVALLEAMFAGKPVLASRCFGIPEVITDGEHGLLVPPGDEEALADGLRRLITDPALRVRLARAGSARVAEAFSAAAMVDKYEAAYGLR